jgi:lysophospholipase
MREIVTTADNTPPAGATVEEIISADGLALRVVRWRARRFSAAGRAALGTVVICGGRAEFAEKYFEIAGELLDRGFSVVVFDWRGQGGSARELDNGRKGHIDDFSLYGRDLSALRQHILEPHCSRPWFALAHSMGGAILLDAARKGTLFFERMVLTAPMIDIFGLRRPKLTRLLAETLDIAGFGAAFIPGGGETSVVTKPFEANVLTSDKRRYSRNAEIIAQAPELGLGDPTIGWVNAAFRLMARFADPEFPRRTLTPTLVIASGADVVVDTRAIERFSTRLKAGALLVVPQARHEIMMERDPLRAQFWAAFDAFVPGGAVAADRSLKEQVA